MPVEPWTTSPRAYVRLVHAGADPRDARTAVDDAVRTVGRRFASRRVLPEWAVKVMLDELEADLGEE